MIHRPSWHLILKLPKRWRLPWLHLDIGRTTFHECAHHPKPHEFDGMVIVRPRRSTVHPPSRGWNIWIYLRDGRAWCWEFVIDRRVFPC